MFSLEVFFVAGFLFILHFFLFRWLLRKKFSDPRKRALVAAALATVAAPLFYMLIVLGAVLFIK